MRYKVLEGETADSLMKKVNMHLSMGYECLGGVSVALVRYEVEIERKGYSEARWEYTYAQAVVAPKGLVVIDRPTGE